MKIDNPVNPVGGETSGMRSRSAKSGGSKQPAAPASAGSDVALSPLSSKLQHIESTLASSPTMDAGRVAEIRQAIAQGNFKIDPGKIADGLIESVRQMLTAQQK